MEVQTTITTNEKHKLEINRTNLIEILRKAGYDITDGANAHVRVPGGGDWSNTDLDIDADSNLIVTWEVSIVTHK